MFLEEKRYRKLGGKKYIKLEVGFIFATNVDLDRAISQKLFRKDLYYRINNCIIKIPPLRERLRELEALIVNIIRREKLRLIEFPDDAMRRLKEYRWPGEHTGTR